MNLVVLGSGTSVPHPRRASTSHWVETRNGSLLLDVSAPAVHRMAQENLDWVNLDAVWVSHFHLDHVGGLAPFLFATKHAPQTRSRRKPLSIYGGRGLKRLFRAFDEANDYKLTRQPFPVEIFEVSPRSQFEILPGVCAGVFSTPHTRESLALRLTDEDGASLVYTSDTGYTDALAQFAANADLFMVECSFRRDKPVRTHLELEDAMRLARRAKARRVLLGHLYPEWDGVDISGEAKKLWPGETIAAEDGLRLRIQAESVIR
ncbi:MAG TPA: ribonuclease Z [Pyrinomonadaceae bacterium]|nr:ribonuclease Z [Pyrinomonadaceae bacterium]